MSGGLFDLMGLTGAKPGDTADDLLKKQVIDPEQAVSKIRMMNVNRKTEEQIFN